MAQCSYRVHGDTYRYILHAAQLRQHDVLCGAFEVLRTPCAVATCMYAYTIFWGVRGYRRWFSISISIHSSRYRRVALRRFN